MALRTAHVVDHGGALGPRRVRRRADVPVPVGANLDEEDRAVHVHLHPRRVLLHLRRAHSCVRGRLAPHRPAFLDLAQHHQRRDSNRRGLLADVGIRRSGRLRQRRRADQRGQAPRALGRTHRGARRPLQDRPREHQGDQHPQGARLHPRLVRPQRRSQGNRGIHRVRCQAGPAGSREHRADG